MSRDRDDHGERERLSWREIDQLRSGAKRGERKPRGKAAEERSAAATKQYLKEADNLFSSAQGGAEGEQLAKAMRDAHGGASFTQVCRDYRESLGMPRDQSLLALFLDTEESELVVAGLEALLAASERGQLTASSGLRSQVRILSQDFDDAVAEAAEELLGQL